MILTIPRALPSWNQFYAGVHWVQRQKMVAVWRALVAEQIGSAEKPPPFDSPVNITVTRYGSPAIDPDNICAKLAIDGLVSGGILKDDSPAHVESVVLRSVKRRFANKGGITTIEIKETK